MARALAPALEACLRSPVRSPEYRIEVYDLRSTEGEVNPTRVGDVVRANLGLTVLPEIVGPRDFTADVVSAELDETDGDFVEGGVASSALSLRIADPAGLLDPITNPPTPADPQSLGRWLRQGNVVCVREGDARVPLAQWVYTFTGRLRGQVGCDRNRTSGAAELVAVAQSREADFARLESTSDDFMQTTPFGEIARTLAEVDLGLDPDEIDLPLLSVRVTAHAHTQFVDENPLVSLAKLLFPDGFMPRFDGAGRLTASSVSIRKGAVRSYPTSEPILAIVRPQLEKNAANEVEVVGLSADQSEVAQGRQTLANASITTGFFARDAKIPVRWSDDGTQQAFDVRMEVESSIRASIFSFGSESFKNGATTTDGGSTRGEITVKGGLASNAVFASILAGAWIFGAWKPDAVNISGAHTISIGRLIHAAVGQTLFTILGRVGRGQYKITGRPYEYVFAEIRALARVKHVRDEERNTVRIENQLIYDADDAAAIALRTLERLRAQQQQRQVAMLHDLALEPGDIFAVGEGSARREYQIGNLRRTLSRIEPRIEAQLECFEVTRGLRG